MTENAELSNSENLLEGFEMPESASDSESDDSAPQFSQMMFKFCKNGRIYAFADNKLYAFDGDLQVLSTKEVAFPHSSIYGSSFPALVFGDVCFGIFDRKVYRFSEAGIEVARELEYGVEPFYTFAGTQIVFQNSDTFKFAALDTKSLAVLSYKPLQSLKIREPCYLFNKGGEIFVFQKFCSAYHVVERTQDVLTRPLEKPGFQLLMRSFTSKSLVFEIDTKPFEFVFASRKIEASALEEGELLGWEAMGKWFAQ